MRIVDHNTACLAVYDNVVVFWRDCLEQASGA